LVVHVYYNKTQSQLTLRTAEIRGRRTKAELADKP
jgi:hypothetical protein